MTQARPNYVVIFFIYRALSAEEAWSLCDVTTVVSVADDI